MIHLSVRIVLLIGEIYGIISWRHLWERLTVWPNLSLPRHKRCMVLTRLMATTNNVQGDKLPRSTALEKQVQTLVVAVECLMK